MTVDNCQIYQFEEILRGKN